MKMYLGLSALKSLNLSQLFSSWSALVQQKQNRVVSLIFRHPKGKNGFNSVVVRDGHMHKAYHFLTRTTVRSHDLPYSVVSPSKPCN